MESIVKVEIPTFTQESKLWTKLTFFDINLTSGDRNWQLKKEYQEFVDLEAELKTMSGDVPELPSNSWFFSFGKKKEKNEALRAGLEKFLKDCISRRGYLSNTDLIRFLKLNVHIPEKLINRINPIGQDEVEEWPGFRVRDILVIPEKNKFFVTINDLSIVSRVDSYIIDLGLGTSEGNEGLGILSEYTLKEKEAEVLFEFVKRKRKGFYDQSTCLHYDSDLERVFFGFLKGNIACYDVNSEDQNRRFKRIFDDIVHNGKVVGLFSNLNKRTLYSVGEDGFFKLFNLDNGLVPFQIKVSDSKLTCLKANKELEVAYIADSSSNIHVFNLSYIPPPKTHTLSLGQEEAIVTGLDVDFVKGRIFACTSQNQYVHQLQNPDEANSGVNNGSPQYENFKCYTEPTKLIYWAERDELYVGFANGKVSVFEAAMIRNGPIYSFKAHKSAITSLAIFNNNQTLITGSGDDSIQMNSSTNQIKFWTPPRDWFDKEAIEENFKTYKRLLTYDNSLIKFKSTTNQESVPENVPDQVTLIGEYKQKDLKPMDVLMLPERRLFLTTSNYLTDFSGPHGKYGTISGWRESEYQTQDCQYESFCDEKQLDFHPICLHYDPELRAVFIGCSYGMILGFETKEEFEQEFFKKTFSSRIHGGKVTGIFGDSGRKLLYSIGEDGFLNVVYSASGAKRAEVKVSQSKLTTLKVSIENQMAFIGDCSGKVHVYDLSFNPPVESQCINLGTKTSIKGLDVDFSTGIIFISSFESGHISEYKIFTPIKSNSVISGVGGNRLHPKPSKILYWPERKEVYIGYAGGLIAIFKQGELSTGPIHAFQAHKSEITCMRVFKENNTLITGSTDKNIKFWSPPPSWNSLEQSEAPGMIPSEVAAPQNQINQSEVYPTPEAPAIPDENNKVNAEEGGEKPQDKPLLSSEPEIMF